MHWATKYIGKPWAPDASGPASFSCWGLVRHVFKARHDIDMPGVHVDAVDTNEQTAENVAAIKQASQASGWRLAEAPARDNDIVLMRNKMGQRHVGVMVSANGRLGVLHADGHMTEAGPVGAVVWQSLADATSRGYHEYEFWRRS